MENVTTLIAYIIASGLLGYVFSLFLRFIVRKQLNNQNTPEQKLRALESNVKLVFPILLLIASGHNSVKV